MDYVPSFQKVQNVKSTESCGKEDPVELLSADKFLLLQSSIFPLPGQPLTGTGVFSSDAQEFSAGSWAILWVLPYDFTQLEITSSVAHVLLFPSFPQSPRGAKSTAAAGQAKPWAAPTHQPASGSGQPETASGSVLEQSKQVWLVPFNANISYCSESFCAQ